MDINFEQVLFIGPDNEFGGMGAVLDMYARNIRPFKFIPTYPSGDKGSKPLFFVKGFFKVLKTLVFDRKIKIIHLHSASRGSFFRKGIIGCLGKLFGKKMVLHMHGGGFKVFYAEAGVLRGVIRFILRRCDGIICLSQEWQAFFRDEMKLSTTIIIGNPVELNNCNGTGENEGNVVKLLFLGKICDDKGVFGMITFLRTNQYFLNDRIQLVIAGNGEVDRLNELLKDPVLQGRIQYGGWVKDDSKKKLLCESDIYILPSYYEGLPMSILEAMASSKAVISTNVGGIPAIVKNGYNGWLIAPGAFEELGNVFEEIFTDTNILKQYGVNSLQVAKNFTPEVVLKELSVLYEKVLGK